MTQSAETRHAPEISRDDVMKEEVGGRNSDRMTKTVVWYSMVGLLARLLYLVGVKLSQGIVAYSLHI